MELKLCILSVVVSVTSARRLTTRQLDLVINMCMLAATQLDTNTYYPIWLNTGYTIDPGMEHFNYATIPIITLALCRLQSIWTP